MTEGKCGRAGFGALVIATGVVLAAPDVAAHDPVPFEPIAAPAHCSAQKAATDGEGNLYVAGLTPGVFGICAAKLDPAGQVVWDASIPASYLMDVSNMAVDPDGSVYLVGYADGSFAGDDPTMGHSLGYLAKVSEAGLGWHTYITPDLFTFTSAVATDPSGNVFVAGHSGVAIGGTRKGGIDAWIIKFDGNGQMLWSRQPGTTSDDYGASLATDQAGNVYLAGGTYGALAGTKKGGQYDEDGFIIKFAADGRKLWQRQPGSSASDHIAVVRVDADGNVFTVGQTAGAFAGVNKGGNDVWVEKFDAAGHLKWKRQNGTPFDDRAYDAAADLQGNLYFAGIVQYPKYPCCTPLIAKYGADGRWLWNDRFGTDQPQGLAVDPSGNVYITIYSGDHLRKYRAADIP